MKTKEYTLYTTDGNPVTLIAPEGILFPTQIISAFGSFCGAGEGIGEKLVPERIYGLLISAACFIHDEMWAIAEPTWTDFHYCNSVFLHNILQIINACSKYAIAKWARNYRATTYFSSVDIVGAKHFWKLKNVEAP